MRQEYTAVGIFSCKFLCMDEVMTGFFFANATTCPLLTLWSPLPVVAEV
jgi:hypothetical protein